MLNLMKHNNDTEAMISRIELLITKPPENSRVITFTPEIAEYFLRNRNEGNRPRKPAKVREYAAAMKADEWGLTGDTVKFGSDGTLRDGQNRLSACVLAGVPFTTHVVFGIDPRLFVRLDIGRNRNPADIFTIAGVSFSSDTAATVRWLALLTSDNPLNRVTLSNEYLLDLHRTRFSDVEPSVRIGQQMRLTLAHPTGAMAALHYLFSRKNPAKATEFFNRWLNERYAKRSDPIKFLQERLRSIKSQNHGRIHDGVRNALIILAWNAFITDAKVTLSEMQWDMALPFPEIQG